jgi:CheY-like chemotaxis protein
MKKEVYVLGNESRLVVKNFLQDLRKAGCEPTVLLPGAYAIKEIPDKPLHLIICMEELMEFRIIEDATAKKQKTGLSLYLIGNIGNLSLEDEKFLKQLPCVRFQSYPVDMPLFMKMMEKNDTDKPRILVVDDEPIFLRSVKSWLGEEFDVSLLNSGEEVMEFLDMRPVDLILLDYKMPRMDGFDVLRRIRDDMEFQNLPVIFLTASNDKDTVMGIMHLEPSGYILKTMPPEDIKKSVRDFFRNQSFMFP